MEENYDFYDEILVNTLKAESEYFKKYNIEDIAEELLSSYYILFEKYVDGHSDKIEVYKEFKEKLEIYENHISFTPTVLYYILEDLIEKAEELIKFENKEIDMNDDFFSEKDVDWYIDFASKHGMDMNLYLYLLKLTEDINKVYDIIDDNDLPVFNLALSPRIELNFGDLSYIEYIVNYSVFNSYERNYAVIAISMNKIYDDMEDYNIISSSKGRIENIENIENIDDMEDLKQIIFISVDALDISANIMREYKNKFEKIFFIFPGDNQYNKLDEQYRIGIFYDLVEKKRKHKI